MGDWQKKESRVVGGFGSARETNESHAIASSQLAEAASRQSEELFRASFAHAAIGLAINDLQGRFLEVNPAYCSITGYTQAELRALDFQTITHPDDLPKTMEQVRALLAGEIPAFVMEKRYVRKDGNIVWVQNSVAPIRDSEGRPISLVRFSQDISERKRVEQALREADRKYREIFENAGEGIFQTSPEGRTITANPAMARMLGFESPEELIRERTDIAGQHYSDPQRREEFKRLMEEQGFVRGFEYQGRRKDGSEIWISDSVRAVRAENGEVLYYEGIAEDITERKRAEARSVAFSSLARQLSGATAPLDAGRIIVDTAHKLFGWDSCTLDLYDADRDLVFPILHLDTINDRHVDVTALIAGVPPTPKGRRVIDRGAELILRKEPYEFAKDSVPFGDRSRPSAAIMSVPVRHASKVIGILSIQSYTPRAYDEDALNNFQALADHCGEALNRIQAEENLRESEERYRELFENARDAIYVHDLSGRYTSVNRAAEKLSGYTRREILGKNFTDFVAPEALQYVRENLSKKLVEEGETTYEVDVISKAGRRVPVKISSRLILENGVAVGVQGTARDITDRKLAEEAMRTYSRRLVEAQEAERQSIARELHDEIGQVLTAVKINLHSLQPSGGTPSLPRIAESMAIVDEALGRVRDLSLELRPALLDDLGLTAALRWYVDRYSQRTGITAEVASELQTDERLRRELETACFRIAQEALTNIARHARATRVSVHLKLSNKDLLLVVSDDGVGFDARRLLKAGFSISTMGLRGMEERALAVGGDLNIVSAPTRGTEIRATFPLKSKR